MKDILMPLRRLHGKFHDLRVAYKTYVLPHGTKYLVLGTPTHTNIGDSAIVLAEKLFIEQCINAPERIKELTTSDYKTLKQKVKRHIRADRKCVICWHGGGNMGDQWFPEEQFRRRAMEELAADRMILFPQTIYYSDTEKGRAEEQASVQYYNGRKGLTLVAREQKSYDIMQALYPNTEVLLAPDIVLSSSMEDYGVEEQERKGVLICARSDAERAVEESAWDRIIQTLNERGIVYRKTDMYSDCPIDKDNRIECVREKMQEFCDSELVVTDRLHGMVFAALTGTPCIVFSNYNHKVEGTYEWIKYLPYIRYVKTEEEAISQIPELLLMKGCKFDNGPLMLHFEKLVEVVKQSCRR